MTKATDEAQVIADEQAAEQREQERETAAYNAAIEDAAAALELVYGWRAMQSCVTIRALKK